MEKIDFFFFFSLSASAATSFKKSRENVVDDVNLGLELSEAFQMQDLSRL